MRLVNTLMVVVGLSMVGTQGAIAMPVLEDSLDLNTGVIVNSIAYDPVAGFLYIHRDFSADIEVFDQSGSLQFTIAAPGTTSNDFDLDFADSAINVGGVAIAANSLLVANGDDSPEILSALNKNDGSVLASQVLPSAALVGGAYHFARDSFFTVDWQSNDLVTEANANNGNLINSFAPTGPNSFDVNYGDIDVFAGTGNLYIVSDRHDFIREMTPDGTFVRDIDLAGIPQVFGLSGIAIDDINEIVWVSSTGGTIHKLSGVFTPIPIPAPILLFVSGLVVLLGRRKR
ncbi:MAG: hypothetical protein AAF387_16710 [Pseudomonadota bacterium]